MTQPIAKARFRPMIAPILAPVIISAAITSVYAVIAPWIPVTVVPTSSATSSIETFMTELSSVIRNWPDASVNRTRVAAAARAAEPESAAAVMAAILSERRGSRGRLTGVRWTKHVLELLGLMADESRRVGELLLGRRCRAEPELSVRLESRREVVEPHS